MRRARWGGATPVTLIEQPAAPVFLNEYKLSPNGQYILYSAGLSSDGGGEFVYLESVPVTGGSPTRLVDFEGQSFMEFEITANSDGVVYTTDGLYVTPVTTALPVRLSTDDQLLTNFKLSHDSQTVVYSAFVSRTVELFSASIVLIDELMLEILSNPLRVSFPTAPGLRYTIQQSDDLENWTDIAGPLTGDGQPYTQEFVVSGHQRLFLRTLIAP